MTAKRAFTCITSIEVIPRTVTFLRSLVDTGALTNATCYVLCLDGQAYDLIQGLGMAQVKLVRVADIPALAQVSAPPARKLAYYAYACKPFLMRWVIQHEGVEKVLYCDSDLWFVKAPDFLFDQLDTSNILIVGAFINPAAAIRDWQRIVNNIQRTGYYNAGFVGCNQHGVDFLDWWADRCAYDTGYDFYRDISSDQKYLNWVPSLFPKVHVIRNYGVNIKLWILESVPLERRPDGTAMLGGDDLIFFHFSQNLGNLHEWPPEFYPEVSRYLKLLEAARAEMNRPYIDMTFRENRDHVRPLLPKSGKLSYLIRQIKQLPERRQALSASVHSTLSRASRFLPRSTASAWAQRLLNKWRLDGDAADYEAITVHLGTPVRAGELVFIGVSRLALYLAYLGYSVTVYEPFQGHYNADLEHMFNPQSPDAERMINLLAIRSNLKIKRHHVRQEAEQNARPTGALFISARREAGEMGEVLRGLRTGEATPPIYIVFDPHWSETYRNDYLHDLKTRLSLSTPAGVTRDIFAFTGAAAGTKVLSPA